MATHRSSVTKPRRPESALMLSYKHRIVKSSDRDYAAVVGYSLPSYESTTLSHLRQAFPSYICVFRHEQLCGVCGFRGADRGLVLEQFMDSSADRFVESVTKKTVTRMELVELGAYRANPASLTPRFAGQIEHLLKEEGYTYALALSGNNAQSVGSWAMERRNLAANASAREQQYVLSVSVMKLDSRPTL